MTILWSIILILADKEILETKQPKVTKFVASGAKILEYLLTIPNSKLWTTLHYTAFKSLYFTMKFLNDFLDGISLNRMLTFFV